jgi:cbb3-type cytochrome c oxidase subunit III
VRAGAAVLGILAALLAAGCGTGGIVKTGDQTKGKQLFQAKCGGCHTLEAAGTHGTIGPNLDEAFASDRKQGFEQVTIQQVVRQQIALASGKMPADLVKGADAASVSAFVASSAGVPGQGGGGASATSGKDIFSANCGSCHTLAAAGTSGTTGPNLDQLKPALATVQHQVINGGAIMPAFKGQLTDAQIKAVAKYVSSSAGKK